MTKSPGAILNARSAPAGPATGRRRSTKLIRLLQSPRGCRVGLRPPRNDIGAIESLNRPLGRAPFTANRHPNGTQYNAAAGRLPRPVRRPAFHDEMLGAGTLPMEILETRMNRWLADQLRQKIQ